MQLPCLFIFALFRNVATVSTTLGIPCPDLPRASNHHTISVENTDIPLPGEADLHGLTFNGTWLGPTIYARLGQDMSIDVINNANIGEGRHSTTVLNGRQQLASSCCRSVAADRAAKILSSPPGLQEHLSTGMGCCSKMQPGPTALQLYRSDPSRPKASSGTSSKLRPREPFGITATPEPNCPMGCMVPL